ncbi:MAG: RAMP superfamily CRISPR-associated protein [Ruminococcus sp.]|nr:RAMP superfamily CRISPR-associated protein [Ruminococcus sp.]
MNYELRITLKSDICPASGDGFSLTIDTDVCYDEFGLPIIPSRRLKGCMLEAARYIGSDDADIFGVSGGKSGGALRIGNAVLENYRSLREQAKRSGKSAQQILSLFTSVRASTAIENDTAKKESLRFMRVINRCSPFDEAELTFTAPIEIDEKFFDSLERICRATRNIGYKRSRGFGAVNCRLVKSDKIRANFVAGSIIDDGRDYVIRYSILTNSPIMTPGSRADETDDFIGGTSVMGFFASGYLNTHNADEKFEEIFLKDNLIFSNLYILSDDGTAAVPASFAIAKDKTADGQLYVNSLVENKDDRILKPLKGGYFANGGEVKVKTETIYHHSEGEDGTLYTQTCISEGQRFGSTICGKGKYLREILEILGEGIITVGRSKTAQYAECEVCSADISECVNKTRRYAENEKIAAVFCSDAIFIDENGTCCTEFDKICEKINISGADEKLSFMKDKIVAGYMSAGGYKKPHLRAVKAGSTICFSSDKALELPEVGYFGEKLGEGFGMVRFIKADEIMDLNGGFFSVSENALTSDNRLCELLEKNDERETVRNEAINYAEENRDTLTSLTSSFVGRILLMIRQSDSYDDLLARINSVKDKNKRQEAERVVKTAEKYSGSVIWREYLENIFLLAKYFNRRVTQ